MLQRVIQAWNKTNRWHRVVGMFAFVQLGVIPQRIAGYYCNDSKLSHPYTGDTVSWKLLLAVAILLPLFVMYALERNETNKKISKNSLALHWYGEYSFGLMVNVVVVQVIKVLVGAPRPHFFDVCKPDVECEGKEFVSYYECTKTIYSDSRMSDSARSFPSGHTSIALHAGLFLAWYLHKRSSYVRCNSVFLMLSAQAVLVLAAVFCGLSRIADRRHHWWDVLAGAILGVFTLVYTIQYLCNNFACVEDKASISQQFSDDLPDEHLIKRASELSSEDIKKPSNDLTNNDRSITSSM